MALPPCDHRDTCSRHLTYIVYEVNNIQVFMIQEVIFHRCMLSFGVKRRESRSRVCLGGMVRHLQFIPRLTYRS